MPAGSRNLASGGWHHPTRQICETTRFVPGALANGAATTCSRGMSVCRTYRYSSIFSLTSLFFQIAKGPVHDPSFFVLSVTNFPPSDVGLASHRPGMCVCVPDDWLQMESEELKSKEQYCIRALELTVRALRHTSRYVGISAFSRHGGTGHPLRCSTHPIWPLANSEAQMLGTLYSFIFAGLFPRLRCRYWAQSTHPMQFLGANERYPAINGSRLCANRWAGACTTFSWHLGC